MKPQEPQHKWRDIVLLSLYTIGVIVGLYWWYSYTYPGTVFAAGSSLNGSLTLTAKLVREPLNPAPIFDIAVIVVPNNETPSVMMVNTAFVFPNGSTITSTEPAITHPHECALLTIEAPVAVFDVPPNAKLAIIHVWTTPPEPVDVTVCG